MESTFEICERKEKLYRIVDSGVLEQDLDLDSASATSV